MTLWPFRRKPPLSPDETLRLCCLQMAGGDILKAVAFRDWIVDGKWPRAQAAVPRTAAPAPAPTLRIVPLFDPQRPCDTEPPGAA